MQGSTARDGYYFNAKKSNGKLNIDIMGYIGDENATSEEVSKALNENEGIKNIYVKLNSNSSMPFTKFCNTWSVEFSSSSTVPSK